MLRDDLIEAEVRAICPGDIPSRGIAVLSRRPRQSNLVLKVQLGAAEAHALAHELEGAETYRSQGLCVFDQLLGLCGCRVVAACLLAGEAGTLSGALRVETGQGPREVPAPAGLVLAVAVRLKVPLLVQERLLPGEAPALPAEMARFIASLDLSDLGDPGHE